MEGYISQALKKKRNDVVVRQGVIGLGVIGWGRLCYEVVIGWKGLGDGGSKNGRVVE